MSLIKAFIDRCLASSPRIAVVGDSMIDEYHYVKVNRVSPEFPIPVMLSESEHTPYSHPGGAANTAYQFSELNCKASLISFLDSNASQVFKEHGIDVSNSMFWDTFKIPRKKRFYQDDNPLCRLDIERENYGIKDIEPIRRSMSFLDKKYDIAILSDYGKGFFSDNHQWCNLGIPTIVDPKNGPLKKWQGCTIFKPNANDARILSEGRTDKKLQVAFLYGYLGCKSVVVTDAGNGVYGYDNEECFEIKNDRKIVPRSTIGAGDCFSAFLALAIAHKFSVRDASKIAFAAGQVYCTNIHNKPVTFYDLLRSVDPIGAKFLDPPNDGGKLVLCNGVFDLLHSGHLAFLRFAKSKGDRLIVALNSDESVRRLKGESRPIRSLKDRMEMIASLSFVDFVTSFNEDKPLDCIEIISPDLVVTGEEYKNAPEILFRQRHLGIKTEFFPRIEGISTTGEIMRMKTS